MTEDAVSSWSVRERLRELVPALIFGFILLAVAGLVVATMVDRVVSYMAAVFLLIGLFQIGLGIRFYRKYSLIRNTATQRARSVAMGRTELEGVCRPHETVFDRPFDDGSCLYARWEIEEYRRTGDEYEWSTVARGRLSDTLYCEDETGRILVDDPAKAEVRISDRNTKTEVVGSGETPPPEIVTFCEEQEVSPVSANRRRYKNEYLTDGTDLYVFGFAQSYEGETDIVVSDGDGRYPFYVSDSSENQLLERYRREAVFDVLLGIPWSAVSLYVFLIYL